MNRIVNVLTNLTYAAAGVAAWTMDGFSPFVLACLALAAGSAAYHQWHDDDRLGYWSHHADELAMYMVFSSLVLIAVGLHTWLIAVPIWIVLHFIALRFTTRQVLGVICGLLVGAMLVQEMYWQIVLAVGVFAWAYFVHSRDTGEDFTWYHASWHVWTGFLIAVLYAAVS